VEEFPLSSPPNAPVGQYELLKNVALAWGKEENWKIARLMTKDDLRGTDLGTF
jgi:hypothetical protein